MVLGGMTRGEDVAEASAFEEALALLGKGGLGILFEKGYKW